MQKNLASLDKYSTCKVQNKNDSRLLLRSRDEPWPGRCGAFASGRRKSRPTRKSRSIGLLMDQQNVHFKVFVAWRTNPLCEDSIYPKL
jgi:hypothetical protein